MTDELGNETLKKYINARQQSWEIINEISCIGSIVATAAKSPDADSQLDPYVVGFLNQMIANKVMRIQEIFDNQLGTLDEIRNRLEKRINPKD